MTLEGSNFHQMVLNLKGDDMVHLKKSQGVLWILCIILKASSNLFGSNEKKTKLLGNYVQIPPRVMAKLALQIKYDPPKFKIIVWECVSDINGCL